MDNKQMYVQVVNLNTGKIFSLPTLYTDRTKACVCGQDYIRDRQAENISELLFFRVLDVRPDGTIAPSNELWSDEGDNDEEPEHGESVYGNNYRKLMEGILEVCEEYGVNLVIPRT